MPCRNIDCSPVPCRREPDSLESQWRKAKQNGDWHDWQWQFRNRIRTIEALRALMPVSREEDMAFKASGKNLPFAVTPYYAELIDSQDPLCPIRKTVIPRSEEFATTQHEMLDPCGEEGDSPMEGLVHRYPDRVLFLVNDLCSVYCRYCTRSRIVGSGELRPEYERIYQYIEQHREVRDVLISGGDPLVLSTDKLEAIIRRLRAIPHVEIIRIGSKIPVVMPQRITPELVDTLKKYHPLYMSIHVLHPQEITPEVTQACNRLADAGIPTFSQTVLLNGVNDDPAVMKGLMLKLLALRVRPYYIYQCDPVQGTSHFRTDIKTGLRIMEHLRGHSSGYAVPTYAVDAPGGGGKIPISPDYIVEEDGHRVVLRNYAGEIYTYHL